MTHLHKLMADIRDANLSYLMLSQAILREDRTSALFRMGLTQEVANILAALTPAQIIKLAQSNMLICRPRFDDHMVWTLLSDHSAGKDQEKSSAARLHASILMAGQVVENP